MPETLRVRDCVLVRGTDKGYIECLNKDNYVTVFLIVGRNTEIVTHNQCCHVPIVKGTVSRSDNLHNISSTPNKHALLIIYSQRNQA